MVNNLFKKSVIITPDHKTLITNINSLEPDLKLLTDNEILSRSNQLQKRYNDQQNLDLLIAEAFALTREASVRTVGLRHFDVQLLGGLVLNNNQIAEMRTGEGKT